MEFENLNTLDISGGKAKKRKTTTTSGQGKAKKKFKDRINHPNDDEENININEEGQEEEVERQEAEAERQEADEIPDWRDSNFDFGEIESPNNRRKYNAEADMNNAAKQLRENLSQNRQEVHNERLREEKRLSEEKEKQQYTQNQLASIAMQIQDFDFSKEESIKDAFTLYCLSPNKNIVLEGIKNVIKRARKYYKDVKISSEDRKKLSQLIAQDEIVREKLEILFSNIENVIDEGVKAKQIDGVQNPFNKFFATLKLSNNISDVIDLSKKLKVLKLMIAELAICQKLKLSMNAGELTLLDIFYRQGETASPKEKDFKRALIKYTSDKHADLNNSLLNLGKMIDTGYLTSISKKVKYNLDIIHKKKMENLLLTDEQKQKLEKKIKKFTEDLIKIIFNQLENEIKTTLSKDVNLQDKLELLGKVKNFKEATNKNLNENTSSLLNELFSFENLNANSKKKIKIKPISDENKSKLLDLLKEINKIYRISFLNATTLLKDQSGGVGELMEVHKSCWDDKEHAIFGYYNLKKIFNTAEKIEPTIAEKIYRSTLIRISTILKDLVNYVNLTNTYINSEKEYPKIKGLKILADTLAGYFGFSDRHIASYKLIIYPEQVKVPQKVEDYINKRTDNCENVSLSKNSINLSQEVLAIQNVAANNRALKIMGGPETLLITNGNAHNANTKTNGLSLVSFQNLPITKAMINDTIQDLESNEQNIKEEKQHKQRKREERNKITRLEELENEIKHILSEEVNLEGKAKLLGKARKSLSNLQTNYENLNKNAIRKLNELLESTKTNVEKLKQDATKKAIEKQIKKAQSTTEKVEKQKKKKKSKKTPIELQLEAKEKEIKELESKVDKTRLAISKTEEEITQSSKKSKFTKIRNEQQKTLKQQEVKLGQLKNELKQLQNGTQSAGSRQLRAIQEKFNLFHANVSKYLQNKNGKAPTAAQVNREIAKRVKNL